MTMSHIKNIRYAPYNIHAHIAKKVHTYIISISPCILHQLYISIIHYHGSIDNYFEGLVSNHFCYQATSSINVVSVPDNGCLSITPISFVVKLSSFLLTTNH